MTKSRQTNVFFLFMVVFYLISCFYLIPLVPDNLQNSNFSIIFGQLLVFIPLILYVTITKGQVLKGMKFKRIGVLNTFLLFVFTYCMLPIVSLLNVITMFFTPNRVSGQMNSMSDNSFFLNLFLIAILPAVLEEITFRGIIYGGYRNSTIKRAMFASALLFGLFHMNINQFCYAFFMGIVFVLVREATGSMHCSMIMHFIFNANSVVLLKLIELFTDYVNKLAKTDDSFSELADNLNKSTGETVTTFADYPLSEKLTTLLSISIAACFAGVLGFFILRVIAERCNRLKHLNQILCSVFGKIPKDREVERQNEYVENNTEKYGGKIVDFVFVLSVILCVLVIIYIEIR